MSTFRVHDTSSDKDTAFNLVIDDVENRVVPCSQNFKSWSKDFKLTPWGIQFNSDDLRVLS